MKTVLDRAIGSMLSGVKGLRAVVLSVAPDGLIAWSWADDDKHDIALGFAALDRAATVCLGSLGASQASRSMLLTARDTWVAAWPLFDVDSQEGEPLRERLVITTVFAGELQTGMVMVYGSRVRLHIRDTLLAATEEDKRALRQALVSHLSEAADPCAALECLAKDVDIDLRRLGCPEQLHSSERARLLSWLGQSAGSAPRLLQ